MTIFNPKNFEADHTGFKTTIWHQQLVEGESIEECLNRNAYARVMTMRTPKRNDLVRVYSHDGREFAEFHVLAADKTWLQLAKIREFCAPEAAVPEEAALDVRWNVGKRCFEVVRKSDKAVLVSDFQAKEDATNWIVEHTKQMAA